jgi:hypothetical protein
MHRKILTTEFAPAERVPIAVIHRQRKALESCSLDPGLINSLSHYVFILNQQRQIVFAGPRAEDLLPGRPLESILGMRPGEALGCGHAQERDEGCGTTAACRECAALKAILASLDGKKATLRWGVTRVLNLASQGSDVLVSAVPFEHSGERYSILSIEARP